MKEKKGKSYSREKINTIAKNIKRLWSQLKKKTSKLSGAMWDLEFRILILVHTRVMWSPTIMLNIGHRGTQQYQMMIAGITWYQWKGCSYIQSR